MVCAGRKGKEQRGLCWGSAGTRRGAECVSPGDGGALRARREGGRAGGQSKLQETGPFVQRLRGAAGKGRGGCVCRGPGHPTSREPPSGSSPSPARAAAATLWPGLPEALAAAKSRFCAAAPAPVSLTLEPAAYLSNSEGTSAAAEGKKVTSAAEQGGEFPAWAPLPSHHPAQPREGPHIVPKKEAWRACLNSKTGDPHPL